MNNKKNDLILQYENDLRFDLNDSQADFFLTNFHKYQANLTKMRDFDFVKYEKYLYPSFDEKLTISFHTLREDEPNSEVVNQNEIFKNAVKFVDGYVVLKNEK